MIKVAICDNNIYYREKIADLTLKSLFDTIDITFRYYDDGLQIIDEAVKNIFNEDLLFIDIILPCIDGIKTVKFLRQLGITTDVIFVTEAMEYCTEGYKHHAFDFIEKPIAVSEFEAVMRRYIQEKIQYNTEFLQVMIRGSFCKINLKKVIYFESIGRKIRAVEKDNATEFYQKLDYIEQQLEESGFLRIHQSYIVNKLFVSFANSSEIVLLHKIHLPVSKKYTQKIKDTFRL